MRIKLLLCAVSALLPLDPIEPRPVEWFTTNFDVIGPFEQNPDDYYLTGSYLAKRKYSSLRERLSISVGDGDPVYVYTTKEHSVSIGDRVDLSMKMPLKSLLTSEGITGKFIILNSSNIALRTHTFKLKPIVRRKINVKDYLDEYYECPDVVVDIDDYEKNHIEKFMFTDFIDYFNTNSYYRIDISNLMMSYESPKEFPTCRGSLHFIDYNKLFPYLDSQEVVPSFDIPVIAEQNEGKISFRFENNMYVHPVTLDMSLVARPGFQLTRYFYLPVNKSEEMLNQVFTLKMEEFGHAHISFDWDIRYLNNRNLVGDCSNSDYCVQGEII